MLRKRYTVVVVGQGGMSLAQRSELSRHRGLREALAAAEEARARLTVMHGDRAGSYLVVVERDGIPVSSEEELGPRPAILDLDLERDAPELLRPPVAEEGVRVIRRTPREPEDERHDTAEHPALFSDLDIEGDAALESLLEDDPPPRDPPPRERDPDRPRRLPSLDDIPSGRVPDDVLKRFEEAIAREERRRTQRPPGGPG